MLFQPTYQFIYPATQPQQQAPLLLSESLNEERLPIRLTEGKRAYLSYPSGLNEKDIAILKLQLESLALTL
ncbi:hypothetical protein VF04_38125 [Nostoc linckia z7]|uniref:Uncharacterized protein n=1 Tax=Nostoc linckia z7 TaxID=1628745 RepID=A0ABX4KDB2_NOSLI|nr:hypothetical protein VF02_37945 [Nostoc linckia z1]PHJ59289.1 hypothetical protein VF05_32365 [Nostoc linckia z3]PHJ63684.1 hypothetical protein VF03_30240 [Nostoc linckia z2]PHJ73854.1 hypothetical protein VF06_35650 [Nostoc linckia z4]PHJ79760.1 hypothetical protein VF04_38125 [Nostoc linckia z7]